MAGNLLVACFLMLVSFLSKLEIDPTLGFRYGVQSGGNLYVSTSKIPLIKKFPHERPGTLWQIDINRGGATRRIVVRTYNGPDPGALRWTIQNSILYSAPSAEYDLFGPQYFQFRLEDVHLLDINNPQGEDLLIKKYNLDARRVRAFGLSPRNSQFGFVGSVNSGRFFEDFAVGAWPVLLKPQDYSIWVSPDGLVSEFLVHNHIMYYGLAVKISPGRGKPAEVRLSARRQFKVEFQEPFLVFADLKSHFFVTKSGKVYRVPRLDLNDKTPESASRYYFRPNRPIRTIVTSPDHMRTFVAGHAGKDQFYFELNGDFIRADESNLYEPDLKADFPKPIEDVCRFAKFLNEKKLFSMPDEKVD